jgi:protocatechuate 3,4-dioxygenase beta subunit
MIGRDTAARSRRAFLWTWLALPAPLLLAACGGQSAGSAAPAAAGQAQAPTAAPAAATPPPAASSPAAQSGPAQPTQVLQPTPECADDDDLTPAQTEGPYFKRSSPERASLLESGLAGTRLVLTGKVLTTECRPVARALLDFWQADDRGAYDNTGFRLRGHQFADESGQFRLETIVPGLYPGRTRHIHVKVQAPNRPVLTTQLYFPGEPRNANDSIFNQDLVISLQDTGGARQATFDFVLNVR